MQSRSLLVADDLGASIEADVFVMQSDFRLGRRRENRLRELRRVHQARRQLDAAYRALCVVLLQAAAGQIAAHDAFDREHLGLAHQHEAAAQVVSVGLKLFRKVCHIRRNQVVFDNALEQFEPEHRNLRENSALVRNLVLKNVVERRNAIGRNEQQLVTQIVKIANLALRIRLDIDNAHV